MSSSIAKRNNVHISGNGKNPIVFAHGFGSDQTMWKHLVPVFEKDYRVILFDYAGHGKSDPGAYSTKKYNSLSGYADDVLSIIDDLHLKDVILVGHSVSNMIAVIAANKRPELFKSLVMIGASPRYLNDKGYAGGYEKKDLDVMLGTMEKDYKGWVHFLSGVTMKNPDRPDLSAELEKTFMGNDPGVIRQFAGVTFFSDHREDIKKLKVPALVLQTDDDIIAPRSVGDYLVANMPHATLRMLNASGHCPHMSAPLETETAIREYLGWLAG